MLHCGTSFSSFCVALAAVYRLHVLEKNEYGGYEDYMSKTPS